MKLSFRYRKITLRQEKPLFVSKQDGADSSEEEGENENGGADMTIQKCVPILQWNQELPMESIRDIIRAATIYRMSLCHDIK